MQIWYFFADSSCFLAVMVFLWDSPMRLPNFIRIAFCVLSIADCKERAEGISKESF
jgi:hypothetical protein